MLNFSKNQRLFFSHILIRDLAYGLGTLGWAYLFLSGVSIVQILIGLLSFRILQSVFFLPITQKLWRKMDLKKLALLAMVLQSVFLFSFRFAHLNIFLFILTIILFAFSDSLYYAVRTNLERLTPPVKDIAKNVGIARSIKVIASILGLIIFAYLLNMGSLLVFIIAALGIFLSYIPIRQMDIKVLIPPKNLPFFKEIFLGKFWQNFIRNPLVLILIGNGFMAELIEIILPLFLVFSQSSLIEIGIWLSLMQLMTVVSTFLAGTNENKNKHLFFYVFGFLTLVLFITFIFVPLNYTPIFLLIFGIIGITWQTSIMARAQKDIFKYFKKSNSGGIFLEWIDMTSRALAYPVMALIVLFGSKNIFKRGLFSCGSAANIFIMTAYYKLIRK